MQLAVSFTLRFRTHIAGHAFYSEIECDSEAAVRDVAGALETQDPPIDLVAAYVCVDFASPNGNGCHLLDEESDGLLEAVLEELKVGQESFWNHRIGYYDELNNRVNPVNLGHVFPDGTMRLFWDVESAVKGLDDTLRIAKGAAELLLELQEIPYFCQNEQEFEEGDYQGVVARRRDLLFQAGFWPDEEDRFLEEDEAPDRYVLLAPHRLAAKNPSTTA